MKTGCVVCVIGAMGEGKSPYVKNLVRNSPFKNKLVNDVRYEYTGEKYPEDKGVFITFHDFEVFKNCIFELPGEEGSGITKAEIIFEEATIYGGRIASEDFKRFIFAAQHRNLFVYLMYHSVKDTPEFLIRNANVIILFNTGENPDGLRDDRALLKPYMSIKKTPTSPCIINVKEMITLHNSE
jgi:hypothetical protein